MTIAGIVGVAEVELDLFLDDIELVLITINSGCPQTQIT
jgi:hypothetical protein